MSDYLTPEQEQAEEDAAIARAEDAYTEARDAHAADLLRTLEEADADVTLTAADARLIADMVMTFSREARRLHESVARIAAELADAQPPF